jgi:hypothetical protein
MRYETGDPEAPIATVPIPFRYDPEIHVLQVPEDDPLEPSSGVCGAGACGGSRDPMLSRRIEDDYRRRGTVEPIPVAVVEDVSTIPLPISHIQAE